MKNRRLSDSYSHILKYTGLFGGVQGLGILVGLVRNKLVAVILGPQGMGLVSLFNSTVKFVSDSTNFGIAMSAVKSISEKFDHGDRHAIEHAVGVVRSWSLLAALFGMLVCIVLSPLLSWLTFAWNGHTLHFICLSPVVGLMAVIGGELAILKGVRQLKSLATISILNMVAALVISVPIYYFFGNAGIVPSLVLMALAQMVLTIRHSYRLYPLKVSLSRRTLGDGAGMIRLGAAFVMAGILGSGAEFAIRTYMNNATGIDAVGLYNAGVVLSLTYVGLIFSAMETDYFPRLSGVNDLGVTFRTTVNRQIEVMLLLVAPFLTAFMTGLPIIIPLLFSGKFTPVIDMVRIVLLAMYFRALKLPVQYIPLAKGDSKSYLLLEASYDCIMVVSVIVMFRWMGLNGAGIGLFFTSLCDLVITFVYTRWKYGFRPSARVVLFTMIQLPVGVACFLATSLLGGIAYWTAGVLLTLASGAYSLSRINRTTK